MTAAAQHKPLIWSLDVATVIGWAHGRAGERPQAKSFRLAPQNADSNELFAGCMTWFSELLERETLPDILALEELLPPTARRGTTNIGAQHRLAGMHGVIRALARQAGIPEIISATVPDIRQHFIGERNLAREQAKPRVMTMCKALGWYASNTDCGDALALWSYTNALLNPHAALLNTPLFGHRTWEDVAREREAKQRD